MAKIVNYTNPQTKLNVPTSFWFLDRINISVTERRASFTWGVWTNKAAFLAGAEPFHRDTVNVTGNAFLAGMAAERAKTKTIEELAYDAAAEQLRVQNQDGTSRPMFEGATDEEI